MRTPSVCHEAARVDGASELRIAWSIKVPALIPSLALAGLLAVIGGFQLFNEPNLLRPMAAQSISSSFSPNLYIYSTAFASRDIGYATAMSILLGLIIVAVTLAAQSIAKLRSKK